jgi:hypothetical protein
VLLTEKIVYSYYKHIGMSNYKLHQNVQAGSGTHPVSYALGTGVLSRGSVVQDVKLTIELIVMKPRID